MKSRKQVAVLGLGRFGRATARELARIGHDVLAIDADPKLVQAIADEVGHAVQADITDEEALAQLGLEDYDAIIIGITGNLEVSILATVLLDRLGARRIIAKAADAIHGTILERVGAHVVVYPEREAGFRIAHSFAAPAIRDYLDVVPGFGIARISVSERLAGRTLADHDLARTYGVTPVALCRAGRAVLSPSGTEILQVGDELIVAGFDVDLERVPTTSPVARTARMPPDSHSAEMRKESCDQV